MEKHQIHFERKFYLDKKTGYWISTTTSPRTRAHVWVWQFYNGKIKKGFHIHHMDGNKSNNDISNLQCLSIKEHFSKHDSEERRKNNLIHISNIRPLTKEWHASEEGRKWHKENGLISWEKRKPIEIKCKQCNKSANTKTYHQEFCSNACKSKWRRKNRLDDIERECPVCKNTYISSKYSRSKTCGAQCGRIFKVKIN
jgi:uncharacterized CHY-type Zn-finger protein